MKKRQGGGFGLGLIVGLLGGLAIALAVALYVTKVPIPWVNKVPQHATSASDAAEKERNRDWDPNAPLHGNNPARASTGTAATTTPATGEPDKSTRSVEAVPEPALAPARAETAAPQPAAPTMRSATGSAAPAAPASVGADSESRQAAAIFSDRPAPGPAEPALSTKSRDDPFIYFVQAGAYGRPEDAEQQRARLAMLGVESRVSEREQAGRTVYRVRVGPFDKRERADETKARLASSSMEGVLVRVQK